MLKLKASSCAMQRAAFVQCPILLQSIWDQFDAQRRSSIFVLYLEAGKFWRAQRPMCFGLFSLLLIGWGALSKLSLYFPDFPVWHGASLPAFSPLSFCVKLCRYTMGLQRLFSFLHFWFAFLWWLLWMGILRKQALFTVSTSLTLGWEKAVLPKQTRSLLHSKQTS